MAVVIKELAVKVSVEEPEPGTRRTDTKRPGTEHDKIIEECVEKVLEVLEQKRKR